jgi:hypothetical protein
MTSMLELKQKIKLFYSKNEAYLVPLFKFVLAFICLAAISGKLGYISKFDRLPVRLVVALLCSFMPWNFEIFIAALFSIMHVYSLSMEYAVVTGAVFLLMFLLYFRFAPKDTMAVLLTPLCFALKIPYAVPVSAGLIGNPSSAVSVCCGVMAYYMLDYASKSADTLSGLTDDKATEKYKYVIDGAFSNKSMILLMIAFSVTIILVYMLRRLSIDHAWSVAILAGTLVDIMILLISELMIDTDLSIVAIILGSALGAGIAAVIHFFAFYVDYTRTENVQFEDDDYYYYVKAVPKVTLSAPEKKVKKINSQRHERSRN